MKLLPDEERSLEAVPWIHTRAFINGEHELNTLTEWSASGTEVTLTMGLNEWLDVERTYKKVNSVHIMTAATTFKAVATRDCTVTFHQSQGQGALATLVLSVR